MGEEAGFRASAVPVRGDMMDKHRIFIGIPTLGWTTMGLASSMCQLVEGSLDPRSRFHFSRCWIEGARPADYARNLLCQKFLLSDCERIWFMDADTSPPKNILDLLTMDADIVSGLTPTWGNHSANVPPQPNYTAYRYDESERGLMHVPIYNKGIEPVDAVGPAMMLIKRRVIEDRAMRLSPEYLTFDDRMERLDDDDAPAIFREVRKPNGQLDMSEDLDFCWRARKLGYKVMVNHGVKCNHVKEVDVLKVIEWGISMQTPAPSAEAVKPDGDMREALVGAEAHAPGRT
jgi:hypothetical protein